MLKKSKISRYLKTEFVEGRSTFDWCFLATGLAVQVLVFVFHHDKPLSLLSGISGIISVILCSQGRISTFFFGFIQISTYLYLSLEQNLYAEVGMNVFYLLSQFYGIYAWRKRYNINENNSNKGLQPRSLPVKHFALIMTAVLLLTWFVGFLLHHYTDDTQPYLDAYTTIPAIVAQILMVMAYRQQWYIWLLIDVLSIVMWLRAGDWCLAAQYGFWCANCIYGLNKWKTE